MRALAAAFALGAAVALAGCDPTVATPEQEVIAVNAYNAAVGAATVYLRRPLCPREAPVCRTQEMSQRVYTALRSGRQARATLLANLGAGKPAPLTALQTLQATYSVIQQIQ